MEKLGEIGVEVIKMGIDSVTAGDTLKMINLRLSSGTSFLAARCFSNRTNREFYGIDS